ncbi:MAG: BASS family bile acid:Na+ symporter [Paraglaciecola sp.]|jgi:BASS family bile acid:Na+ symporter
MNEIDLVRINFNPDQLFLLNICLAFLMFGIALDIKWQDFGRLLSNPKAPLIGLFSEYIILPLITVILVFVFQPPPSLVLGMLLLAVCPGGTTSNFMVHLSGANSALSVLLTSITTLGAIFITPIFFTFLTNLIPSVADLETVIAVSPFEMMKTIFQLLIVPVGIGMWLNAQFPNFTKKVEPFIKTLSLIIFVSFVFFAVYANFEYIKGYVHMVFFIVLAHNGLALLLGYYFSKWYNLKEADARAISIETGIQNSGLALIIVFNFFDGLGGMAIIVAWWGVWHLISGILLATYWKRSANKQ